MVNTAGGITGGDQLGISATAQPGAHLTMTTQAAERAYRAQSGETGRLTNRLTIAAGARLDWLPQETILFEGSALNRSMLVDMSTDARLLLVEPVIFGRAAMGETLNAMYFRDSIQIRQNGALRFIDAMTLDGDVSTHLAQKHIAGGSGALATLIYIAANADAWLSPLRALLPDTAGASLIGDDLLHIRILAADGYILRQSLIPILNHLTDENLPRPWMI